MIVTLASAGPLTQSDGPTGGKFDSAVGPGVGFWVITVQLEFSRTGVSFGTVMVTVGAGLEVVVGALVAVDVGAACAWGRQPASITAMSVINTKDTLRTRISMAEYCAILPVNR